MTALNSLVRVHQWELDEKRQKLVDLERLAEKLQHDLQQIDRDVAAEKALAESSPEGAAAFPRYAEAMRERRQKVAASIAAIESSIDGAREEIRTAFQELKKYQTAQSNEEQREARKRNKREQQELDEIGLNVHRRKAVVRRAG